MERKNITDEEVFEHIDQSINQLDKQRLQELNNLKQVQEIKQQALKLEIQRLSKKYGEDHPRVQKISARLSYNQEMFTGLDKEIKRAKTKTEPFSNKSWRIQGNVFDQLNKVAKGVTVFLSDKGHKWIEALGSTCTDEIGYFSITLDEESVKRHKDQPLYLSVSNNTKKINYVAPEPFFASNGLIDYKDIYLNDDCQPPSTKSKTDRGNSPSKIPTSKPK